MTVENLVDQGNKKGKSMHPILWVKDWYITKNIGVV